ncbi:potassium-transporting ATPase subunit F [Pedobacter sp. KR3-3]|uniref:Potassium-transporting ATPase subunit F n=1 Tax=Pedobacter albus TaxID=3113905 RepID=A0ABU7I691_9SPHI|nr:potassium-transporting ATPase subunit F [Pedobacter sp. KR3-3]MEE1944769.1 potassium-transporting ATPase subunit F [Pedobacter sp. KR3-3]
MSFAGSFTAPSIGSKTFNLMIALFITAVAVFLYMVYVLIKPEKF